MPDIKTIADKADIIVNGYLNDREIAKISEFIKDHYQEMYIRWTQYSKKGYYGL